jgi:hypothetical protein
VLQTAKLLGFAEHNIQILMVARKLTPLGDPARNAPKWFAAVDIVQLAADVDWLNKATKEVSKYWRHKRERRRGREYFLKTSPGPIGGTRRKPFPRTLHGAPAGWCVEQPL